MPRRRKATESQVALPSRENAYDEVVEAYRTLMKRILGGVSTPKDRAELDAARERAQTLQAAYPTLWEKACREVQT